MQKRIYGIETEYGFAVQGAKKMGPDLAIRALFESVMSTESFLNAFMENGGRLYQDTGCHPEFATPECSNPKDAVLYDLAGAKLLERLADTAEADLRRRHPDLKFTLLKNNLDSIGTSYGCHENYMTDRIRAPFEQLVAHMIPFLITRTIFSGAGAIHFRGGAPFYSVSQRARYISQRIGGTTTNDRSIINTRDEPHAIREKYRRLHIILGDSNMSEYAAFLKMGTAGIMLQMIEDGFLDGELHIRNPVSTLKDIAEDLTGKTAKVYSDDWEMTALEVQQHYCERAKEYIKDHDMEPQLLQVLDEWEKVLSRIDSDLPSLYGKIDWVTKKTLIDHYCKRHKVKMDNPKVRMLDLQYHSIRPDGLFRKLSDAGKMTRLFTDDAIEKAVTEAPTDTRANIRSRFIKQAKEAKLVYEVDWHSIRLGNLLNVRAVCDNPFESNSEKVDNLLETIRNAGIRRSKLVKYLVKM